MPKGEVGMIVEQIEKSFDMLASGMIDDGLERINKLLEHPELTDDLRFEIGQLFYQYGFIGEAIAIAEQLTKIYPEEPDLLLFLAELYMENDQEEDSLAILVSISADQGDYYIRAILLSSEMYLLEGLFEVAEYKIKHALEQYPEEKILHTALGEVFYQQEKYSLAILSYERGAVISTYSKLADCYAHVGRFEESLDFYQKAVATDSANPDLLFGYGFVAFQLEQWKLAVSKFKSLIEEDPYYTSVYPLIVDAYLRLGKDEKALSCIDQGLNYDQTNPHLFYLKGELLLKLGDREKAKEWIDRSLGIDDSYILALEKRIEISKLEENWKSALLDLKRLLEILPERGDLFIQMGEIYEELEEWNEAEIKYKAALDIDEMNIEALNRLGFLMRDEGKLDQALSIWRKSLNLKSDQWEIEELLQQYE